MDVGNVAQACARVHESMACQKFSVGGYMQIGGLEQIRARNANLGIIGSGAKPPEAESFLAFGG